MAKQGSPGAIRLLLYVIVAASLAGSVAGWISASGALAWVESLTLPGWAHPLAAMNILALLVPQFIVIALWIAQRNGRGGWRSVASLLIVGLLAIMLARIWLLFGERDLTLGFLATLGLWIYALFAVFFVQRICKPAGILLWLPFVWFTYSLILNFEMMRLNAGMIGGL